MFTVSDLELQLFSVLEFCDTLVVTQPLVSNLSLLILHSLMAGSQLLAVTVKTVGEFNCISRILKG